MSSRRIFLRNGVLTAAAGLVLPSVLESCSGAHQGKRRGASGKLAMRFYPYELHLKHVFTLAGSSRSTTAVMMVELEYDGVTGYGEASMPPYLGESHETAAKFLSALKLDQFSDPFLFDDILGYVEATATGNYAAKASIDIALHDLTGKLSGQPWHKLWGLNRANTPVTSFTIGIDTPDVVRQKVAEAEPYKILKVKLGRDTDKEMIETIRSVSDKPICVDVNQGWKSKEYALEMINWLGERNVAFVEQPMDKNDLDGHAWLTERSQLPIVADEALQTPKDVLPLKGAYSGINIKLMKCGGLRNAHTMMTTAKLMGMKVMLGCMTETSCGISAAAQLSPWTEWADLDGNLLIDNDIFEGVKVVDGKITLNELPGIGVKKIVA
jgi:L-Ala-D/L-Glu epimerase